MEYVGLFECLYTLLDFSTNSGVTVLLFCAAILEADGP